MAIKIESMTGTGLIGNTTIHQKVEITADTAFAKDECGWWGDVLYKSLIDANVYTPEAYPDGWEAV